MEHYWKTKQLKLTEKINSHKGQSVLCKNQERCLNRI